MTAPAFAPRRRGECTAFRTPHFPPFASHPHRRSLTAFGKDTKLIYRHYATLYFIFAVDQAESELGILDLIQVFVEVRGR